MSKGNPIVLQTQIAGEKTPTAINRPRWAAMVVQMLQLARAVDRTAVTWVSAADIRAEKKLRFRAA